MARVEFLLDGALQSPAATSAPYRFTFNGLTAGGHTLAARAVDNAGTNSPPASTSVTITNSVTADGPVITRPPTNVTVVATSNETFNVTATGTAPLAYQWFFNATNALTGATNASLIVPNAQPGSAGGYSVVVTNVAGAVTSSVATLTVLVPPTITAWQPNIIVLRTTLAATVPVTLTVTASNATGYQWSFAGSVVPGETGSALLISNARRTNNGVYSVAVTGPGGTVTTNALLHVIVPQRIQTIQQLAEGSIRLLFRDEDAGLPTDLARLEVHSTTNLRAPITWTTNASLFAFTNGFVQFEDAQASGGHRRFYRIIER